ncbi:MAG: PEP-CTERM sorting domain-containing protein [Chthonomonadales bacterium]
MIRRTLSMVTAWIVICAFSSATVQAQLLGHSIGISFTGNSLSDPTQPGLAPPDTNGAVGLNHYVEFTNGAYAVHDKSTGAIVGSRVTDVTFWNNSGISAAITNTGVSDTRIIFDKLSQRWFAAEITLSSTGNLVLVAVSKTSNPLDGFNATSYVGSAQFADYPVLGVNADGVTISTNNFTSSVGSFSGISVTTIPKADLLAVTPSVANKTTFNNPSASLGFTIQGVTSIDPSIGHTALVAVNNSNFSQLNRTNINGVIGAGASLSATNIVNVAATSYTGLARQPDGTRQIDGLDDRIGGTASAYQVGGNIFLVHGISVNAAGVAATSGSATHNALRLTVLNEASNAVVTESTLFSNLYDYIMPSIAVNQFGDIVVGFTRSGSVADGFLSSYADVCNFDGSSIICDTPFLAGTGTGATGGGLGQANYHLFGGDGERWGDFSATNVDPNDPYSFWTAQEFAGTPTRFSGGEWRTQVTQIALTPRISSATPEPGSLALLTGLGVSGLFAVRGLRRRKK